MKKLTTNQFSSFEFRVSSFKVELKLFLFLLPVFSILQTIAQETDSTKMLNLSEVVVKSTRANEKTGMAFTNVYKQEIRKQNLGQDIPFLLNQLPSVVVTSDAGAGVGYTGIRIRGTDPTRINVTINGVPYNDSESQGVFWVNMPDFASSVQSIQVQRGVGTSTNGAGAFGASININSLGYEKEAYGETNVSYGSFNTLKTNILASTGLLNNHFVIDARLSRISSDGYIDRASSNLRSYYISGGYYNKENFIRFNAFSGKEVTYQAWEGVPQALLKENRTYNPYSYENQVDDYQQDHYQLISSFKLNKNWRFNPTLHYTKGRGFYEQFRADDEFANYGLEDIVSSSTTIKRTDLVRRKWLDNDFFGAVFSLDYESLESKYKANIGGGWNKYYGDHFGEIIWMKNNASTEKNYRWYDNNAIKTDFNIYSKALYQFNDAFNAYLDLQFRSVGYEIKGIADKRQDITQNATGGVSYYQFFNPKLGLNYQLYEQSSVYASYSVGNKEPNRTDFVDNAPVVPKPENLQDLEVGYKTQGSKHRFQANFYNMAYRNQLVLTGQVNGVGEAIRINVPNSYRRGIELESGYQFNSKFAINANATFSKNKIKNFTETIVNYDGEADRVINYEKSDISFSPNVIAGGQISYYPVKSLELSFLSKYVGKQFMDNTSNDARSLDAFFVNDLRMNYSPKPKFCKELNFSLLVNNIFNHLYEPNGYTYSYIYEKQVITENFYYPQAGINFLAAMRIKF